MHNALRPRNCVNLIKIITLSLLACQAVALDRHSPEVAYKHYHSVAEEKERAFWNWLDAQNYLDFRLYRSLYHRNFFGIKRTISGNTTHYNRREWLADRRGMFRPGLRVNVGDVIWGHNDVEFIQYWQSRTYADQGRKIITFAKEHGRWKIVQEEILWVRPWDGALP